MCNKLDDLKYMLDSEQYAIIAFTEMFLSSDIPDSLLLCSCPKYVLLRSDRPTLGGGVAMFCKANLNSVIVPVDLSATGCDCLVANLHGPVLCHLVCCYRPPSCSATATAHLCQLLATICHCNKPVVVVGDFNLPQINWSTYSAASLLQYDAFLDFMNSASLSQVVQLPIRQDNLLDLVLTSDDLYTSGVAVVDSFGTSDHSAVLFSLLGCNEVPSTINDLHRDF